MAKISRESQAQAVGSLLSLLITYQIEMGINSHSLIGFSCLLAIAYAWLSG